MNDCKLVIVGGGAAGLSAAINAASEGVSTILCDSASQFGGQAGTSSLIENLMGFPEGISGKDLMMRSVEQASRFNVDFRAPFNVIGLDKDQDCWTVKNDEGDTITCSTVLLSIGVTYRALNAKNIARFMGNGGVSYGSPVMGGNYKNKTVAIVGGANSAGQAAVYMSQQPGTTVHLIVRSESIRDKMSEYLCHKIEESSNIIVHTGTEVLEAKGKDKLSSVVVKTTKQTFDNSGKEKPISNTIESIGLDKLYILIGAKPKTKWLEGIVPMDKNGFILTGKDAKNELLLSGRYNELFHNDRPFLPTECLPGVFVAGDVRADSVKRVAAAIGEGSRAVNDVHSYLATLVKK